MDIIYPPRNSGHLNLEPIGDGNLRVNREADEMKIPLPYYNTYCRYNAVASKRRQCRSSDGQIHPDDCGSQLVTMSFWEKRALDFATFFFVTLTIIYMVGGLTMCAIRSKMAALARKKAFKRQTSNSEKLDQKPDNESE